MRGHKPQEQISSLSLYTNGNVLYRDSDEGVSVIVPEKEKKKKRRKENTIILHRQVQGKTENKGLITAGKVANGRASLA